MPSSFWKRRRLEHFCRSIMHNPISALVALLADPALPLDRHNRGACGRVGDSLNLTRLTCCGNRLCVAAGGRVHYARAQLSEAGSSVKDLPDLTFSAGMDNDKQGVIAGPQAELSWVLLTSLADMSTTSVVRRTKEQDCGFSVRPP
jgi:hypothetical protein